MSINRHNYEEFFILYMDNELSSEERLMVEAFVQQHPDLKEELDLMLQYKFQPDTSISFIGKEELLKVNGQTPITINNYEEWLVAYVDNELTNERIEELHALMNEQPFIRTELSLLQRSKLHPETIVFADKQSLYRKEDKRRVIPIAYRWIAAAVLVIALGISAVLIISNRSKTEAGNDGVVIINPGTEKQNNQVKEIQPEIAVENKTPLASANEEKDKLNNNLVNSSTPDNNSTVNPKAQTISNRRNEVKLVNNAPQNKTNSPAPEPLNPVNNKQEPKKNEEVIVENKIKPTNNLPKPTYNPNITDKVEAINPVIANNTKPDNSNKVLGNDNVTKNNPEPSYSGNPDIKTASLTELEEGSNNKKSRGLFRKIARTFEKRTNLTATDDNRLLVAGLSFKLK